MAIVFNKELDTTKLNLAFNNNVIEFYSDSGTAPDNATITIGTNTVTIYPNPNGTFRYNFKELIISIINVDNYTDDLEVDLDTSFTYDWTDKITLIDDVVTVINLSNDTTETDTREITWLSGYVDLYKWKQNYPQEDLLSSEIRLLQRVNGDSYYNYYLKYCEGYPFDLTIYGNNNSIDVTNNTNLISNTFNLNKISRLVFSDGRTDVSIEDVLTLTDGYNDLDFNNEFNIRLDKVTQFCPNGIYIKWINSLGGWNYWLFAKGENTTKTDSRGALFNDVNNLEDTISPFISLGKEANKTIKVREQRIKSQYKTLLEDLIDSAKVYLFTGVPFSKNTFNDWMEVDLKDGKFITENPKEGLYTFDFELQLPKSVTRSL